MLSEAQLAAVRPGASRSPVGQQAISSDPWQFVPAAWARLRDASVTGALRNEMEFAVALALARLGLRTTAGEALTRCEHPAKAALLDALASLADDAIPLRVMEATLATNLGALPTGIRRGLAEDVPAWRSLIARTRAFRTTSGATVLLNDDGSWALFVDSPAFALALRDSPSRDGPFYVDGFHAPDAVETLWRVSERPPGGVQPRIVLMAASVSEALTALALKPLHQVLSSRRVEVWCDPHCPRRLGDEAQSRFASVPGWVVTIPGAPVLPGHALRWPRGEPARVLAEAGERQSAEMLRLRRRVDDWETLIDWQECKGRLRGTSSNRPRVLVFTTRYSTYIRHAASDLAETLRRSGCDVLVSMEPDEYSTPSALGVLEAVDRHRPDLIVLINMLRSQMPESMPRLVPVVTWVQDAMPHLFDDRHGRAFGPHDFLVGHLHAEMFSQFGFPRERSLASPVLASDIKFHDARASDDARARFSCEVAYISHQSETPEQFRDRVMAEADPHSPAPRVLNRLYPLVVQAASEAGIVGSRLLELLHDATVEAFRLGVTRRSGAEHLRLGAARRRAPARGTGAAPADDALGSGPVRPQGLAAAHLRQRLGAAPAVWEVLPGRARPRR